MEVTDTSRDQDEEDSSSALSKVPQLAQSATLLPSPIANAVSLVARSSSLYLRLGSFIGGLAIDGARVTTLTGLELSRAVIEAILNRAGTDVALRSTGQLGRAEADSILERSIGTLHSTITAISFAASTGFYLSATALGSATDLSQQLLASLDSILGSTDTSRAISSIVTLIRREFQNPATGREGEKVGVADLLTGICGLALLQRWCARLTEAESEEGRYEEVVWDVVVLNDGRRADVVGTSKTLKRSDSASFVSPGRDEVLETIERDGMAGESSDDDLPAITLKQKIMQTLPEKASVTITTETTTTKTVTVEISGAPPPVMDLPSGVEVVEENTNLANTQEGNAGLDLEESTPRYRVVYRIVKNSLTGTNVRSEGSFVNTVGNEEAISPADVEMEDVSALSSRTVSRFPSPDVEDLSPTSPKQVESPPRTTIDAASPVSQELSHKKPIELSTKTADNIANQKRSRKPMNAMSAVSVPGRTSSAKSTDSKLPTAKKIKVERPRSKSTEKKNSFRDALKMGSGTALSSLWNKETGSETSLAKSPPNKPAWGANRPSTAKPGNTISQHISGTNPVREVPHAPPRGNPNYFSSRDLGPVAPADIPRSPSRTSYYSIHERRRDSIVSHTDTYSIHSAETRPGSPTAFRTHLRAQSNLVRARSEKNIVSQPSSPAKLHRRSKSHVPSIYTLHTNNSATSLVLPNHPRSAFEDAGNLDSLSNTGLIAGLFPRYHLVRNISRFVKFASASYGSSFLRVMGIVASASPARREIDTKHHHEHHSFSNHTQLPPDTILLSSFVDPAGGTDSSGQTGTGVPMVHFVSLDHESKAVVLTCRGTLGFEDVLTDMTCDYDTLRYRGKEYSVHKGIHASARRLIDGGGGRVMITIAAALEEFPDYGLVMCGHSLGGGVTSLLAIMISEPSSDPNSTAFVTSSSASPTQRLLTSSSSAPSTAPTHLHLPPGRPIHVYAYGPPATLSPSLRLETRGLITTIINGQDLVPYLSLGVLHDMQAVALAFKNDDTGAKGEVRARVWDAMKGGFADRWYNRTDESAGAGAAPQDDQWAYAALKALRASMLSSKLVPPGEVFVVDSMPVLQREAFLKKPQDRRSASGSASGSEANSGSGLGLGRPARRSVLRYVRDVEKRFGEVRFGGSMLLDHSPGRYEASLGALARGVLG